MTAFRSSRRRVAVSLAALLVFTALPVASRGEGRSPVPTTAAGHPAEGNIDTFLSEPQLTMRQVFSNERFPNIVVGVDGTLIATWGTSSVRARLSQDAGETWGDEITIASPGFQPGGLTVDEATGDIIAFVEAHHPPADLSILRSTDHGKTWTSQDVAVAADRNGNVPSMHMNEHGITLRHGKHKGRLLRPTRWYAGKNDRTLWPQHYTNAIYSDDGGNTWKTSDPFPAFGTGEATMAELSDGRIYYNSRRHWAPDGENPRRRWTAWSDDGGVTWRDLQICEVLPDGPQDTNYGCMAGLVRLPIQGRDVLIYSNCDSPGGRHHGTVWASFDGGKSWPVKRLVYEGKFAYSSLTAGRPDTKTEGWIFLHFEGGPKGGSTLARFNLSWLADGEETGDGPVPGWLKKFSTNTSEYKVRPVTHEQTVEYKLDVDFYKKATLSEGVLIATSENVSDLAHLEAADQFGMIMQRISAPIADRIRARKVLCILIGHNELTSQLPQFQTDKTGKELDFYNWRSRGFLTNRNGRPTVVFAEEDVLEYEGGMQFESILIHELGHVVHGVGFDKGLQRRLTECFEQAHETGIWNDGRAAQRYRRIKGEQPVNLFDALTKSFPDESPELIRKCLESGDILVNGKPTNSKVDVTGQDKVLIVFGGPKQCYAAKNRAEYWAEGFQCWYETNRTMDHDHNHIPGWRRSPPEG